jgi:hypothetical protein
MPSIQERIAEENSARQTGFKKEIVISRNADYYHKSDLIDIN